jgi:hypothetical protein
MGGSSEISITAAPLSVRLMPRRRKSSADAGTRRSRLRMRLGKGSLPVRVENSPTVTLTMLSTAATDLTRSEGYFAFDKSRQSAHAVGDSKFG